jgi:chromosome segregation ATPase
MSKIEIDGIELNPCPKCGSTELCAYGAHHYHSSTVECNSCGFQIPHCATGRLTAECWNLTPSVVPEPTRKSEGLLIRNCQQCLYRIDNSNNDPCKSCVYTSDGGTKFTHYDWGESPSATIMEFLTGRGEVLAQRDELKREVERLDKKLSETKEAKDCRVESLSKQCDAHLNFQYMLTCILRVDTGASFDNLLHAAKSVMGMNSNLNNELSNTKQQNTELRREVERLGKIIGDQKMVNETAIMKAVNDKNDALQKEVERLRTELSDTKDSNEIAMENLRNERDELQDKLKRTADVSVKWEDMTKDLAKQRHDIWNENEDYKREIAKLRDELKEEKAQHAMVATASVGRAEYASVSDELHMRKQEVERLWKRNSELQNALNENAISKEDVVSLHAEIGVKDNLIAKLQKDRGQVYADGVAKDERIASLSMQCEELKKEVEKLKTENECFSDALSEEHDKLKHRNDAIENLTKQRDEAYEQRDVVVATSIGKAEHEKEVAKLRKELNEICAECNSRAPAVTALSEIDKLLGLPDSAVCGERHETAEAVMDLKKERDAHLNFQYMLTCILRVDTGASFDNLLHAAKSVMGINSDLHNKLCDSNQRNTELERETERLGKIIGDKKMVDETALMKAVNDKNDAIQRQLTHERTSRAEVEKEVEGLHAELNRVNPALNQCLEMKIHLHECVESLIKERDALKSQLENIWNHSLLGGMIAALGFEQCLIPPSPDAIKTRINTLRADLDAAQKAISEQADALQKVKDERDGLQRQLKHERTSRGAVEMEVAVKDAHIEQLVRDHNGMNDSLRLEREQRSIIEAHWSDVREILCGPSVMATYSEITQAARTLRSAHGKLLEENCCLRKAHSADFPDRKQDR